jgi:hypothetical protein
MPLNKIYDICTVIQSSGKFNKGAKGMKSAGENGVGYIKLLT